MSRIKLILTVWLGVATFVGVKATAGDREGKLLPIFQVVRFPNDVCTGTTRNGTCFTAEECSSKGGVNEGSCASGFGVCCVIKLACGGTTSNNNSYIVQSGVTALSSPCSYSVCPCSTDICRIRYDFTTHTLAQPVVVTAVAAAGAAAIQTYSAAIGDCITDTFSINAPGLYGSPIICGSNSGQHMVLDSSGSECQLVNFHIGGSTTTTRSWDIYVTQYTCAQEDIGGPQGCLQYFSESSGTIKTFNYLTTNTAAATDAATTHLQNQHYNACFRRAKGMCYICYISFGAIGTSFGLSVSDDATATKSMVGTACATDYITIPGGTAIAAAAATAVTADTVYRYCGRILATEAGKIATDVATVSVCSRAYPFTLGVVTDNTEVCTDDAANKADICEHNNLPSGTLGFALDFKQFAC